MMDRLRETLSAWLGEQPRQTPKECARTLAAISNRKRVERQIEAMRACRQAMERAPDYPPNKLVPF